MHNYSKWLWYFLVNILSRVCFFVSFKGLLFCFFQGFSVSVRKHVLFALVNSGNFQFWAPFPSHFTLCRWKHMLGYFTKSMEPDLWCNCNTFLNSGHSDSLYFGIASRLRTNVDIDLIVSHCKICQPFLLIALFYSSHCYCCVQLWKTLYGMSLTTKVVELYKGCSCLYLPWLQRPWIKKYFQ